MDYKIGDLVRLKDGREVELEDINEDQQDDEIWASANTSGGLNNVMIDSKDDIVAVVMSAEDAAKRVLPTASELMSEVVSIESWGDWQHIETDYDGDTAYVTVRTPDRQEVSFTLTVSDIHTSDF